MAENHHTGSRRAYGLLVLLLLSVAFYWKLVLTDQYSWLESPDLAHQVLPWLQYQAGEWQQGRFPLWAPFEWGGQPLVGQGQPGAMYPPNWILFNWPLKRGWIRPGALNWYYVLLHAAAAWFMYLLCRDRRRSFGASVIAGMIFAFGGYCGTVDWPQMLNGAIWAPLIWMFHLRAMEGRESFRSSLLCGLFLGLSWLSGHHQVPIFLSLAFGFSSIYFIFRDISNIRWALLTGVVFVLIGGAQTIPAWEYGHLARRWVGLDEPIGWRQPVPYFIHQTYGFQPLSIFGIVLPGFNLATSGFVGITAAVLAGIAVVAGESYFAWLAGAGLLYSLAHFGALEGILYALFPMVDKARSPSMAVVLFGLGMAPLAAAGLDRIGDKAGAFNGSRIARWLMGIAGAILAFYFGWSAIRGQGTIGEQRPVMTALVALGLAGVLLARPSGWRFLLGGLVFLELSLIAPYYFPNRYDKAPTPYLKKLAQHRDIVEYLRAQPQPMRVFLDDKAIDFNFGDWHGIDVFGGYLASITTNILGLDFGSPRVRDLMGVTHWVGFQAPPGGGDPVFRGATGVNVWALADPLPRAWIVHSVFKAPEAADARRLLQNPLFDFRKAAIADREIALANCTGDRAAVLRREASHVVVGVEARCRGLLVVSEIDYPGWQVRVDGRNAEQISVNGMQRGVVVEAGWHRVDFEYRPRTQWIGIGMSALGALFALTGLIMRAKRS